MISGVIAEYGGGPLSGISVQAAGYSFGQWPTTRTDGQGVYRIPGPMSSKVAIEVYGDGYATAFKFNLPPGDQTVNFVMRPIFLVPARGGTINGTIRGDEFVTGDDEFGGACLQTACKVVDVSFDGCPCGPRLQLTLRWANPSSQLALYIPHEDTYFPPGYPPRPADRYCCSPGLTATLALNGDFDRFAVGFEQAAGGRPGPTDTQPFELTVQPVP